MPLEYRTGITQGKRLLGSADLAAMQKGVPVHMIGATGCNLWGYLHDLQLDHCSHFLFYYCHKFKAVVPSDLHQVLVDEGNLLEI